MLSLYLIFMVIIFCYPKTCSRYGQERYTIWNINPLNIIKIKLSVVSAKSGWRQYLIFCHTFCRITVVYFCSVSTPHLLTSFSVISNRQTWIKYLKNPEEKLHRGHYKGSGHVLYSASHSQNTFTNQDLMIYLVDASPTYVAAVTAVMTDFFSQTANTQNAFSSPDVILLYCWL
jgi:hypothetical protein